MAGGSRERWSAWLLGIIVTGSIVVPCVFSSRLQAVFVVPKLGVLWGLLAASLLLVAYGALFVASFPGRARPVWVVDAAVLAFLMLTLLAWGLSTDRGQSLFGERLQHQGVLTTLLYVGFFAVARLAVVDAERLRRLLAGVTVGAALVASYALVQKAGADPVWHGYLPGGRVFSSIGQANALAAYLVLALPIAASFAFDWRRVVRVAALLAVSAIGIAFVFTQSRGGYLGLLAVLGVLAVGWRRELRLGVRRAGYALAIVAAFLVLAAGTGGLGRVVSHSDESARFHRDAWRVAAEIAMRHPLVGTGPETFPDLFARYSHHVLPPDRAAALDAYRVESPHNVYLAIAAGSGIPALFAYLTAIFGFCAVVLREIRRKRSEARVMLVGVLAAAVGHVVTDAFMTAEVTGTWLFWVLLGATLGVVAAGDPGPVGTGPGSRLIS